MSNALTFEQSASILNAVASQATGTAQITPLNTAQFVSLAQTTLKTGYDNVIGAISQVLSRTIFGIRPYTRKLAGLNASAQRYGNHIRKINYVDDVFVDDVGVGNASVGGGIVDGQSIDQYTIRTPKVIQTNFYGINAVEDYVTILRDQLDTAFSSAEEFGRFISGVMTNMSNKHEQMHENTARLTLANAIGAKAKADTGNVIHLLTEYNTATGLNLDGQTVYQPENFKAFMKWAYARIGTLSSLMTERSIKYHMNFTGKPIQRHTPKNLQKVYLHAPARYQTEAMVLADTYHDSYLRFADVETVNFWQSIETPDTIKVWPCYVDASGAVVETPTSGDAVTVENIFGVIFDEEAAGYTTINTSLDPSPYNARGRYYNLWYRFHDRWWLDLTENFVVLLLD